eukprot:TRINITY_DN6771_c0_g1_i9.p1 TRINITY_DN6771_c0_g1~~TRINITY_DN6771_c0_g1_i9.p1  ORF type:complete len:141 (-),score=62.37 TRINITY_DN6771_c0_g1_i9:46-468(-)
MCIRDRLKEVEKKYRESEQDKNEIKIETSNLIRKLKNESSYKENLVDKRVVSKFLVNYFDLNTKYHVKLQILETLSSILSFTEDERNKIGLHKQRLERGASKEEEMKDNNALPGGGAAGGQTTPKIADKLAQFLLNDEAE